jgi:hypothetical protein
MRAGRFEIVRRRGFVNGSGFSWKKRKSWKEGMKDCFCMWLRSSFPIVTVIIG